MTLQEAMDYRGENPATLSDKLEVKEGDVRRGGEAGGLGERRSGARRTGQSWSCTETEAGADGVHLQPV